MADSKHTLSLKLDADQLIKRIRKQIGFQDSSLCKASIISSDDPHLKIVQEYFKSDPDKKELDLKILEQRSLASLIASVFGDALGVHTKFQEFNPKRVLFKTGFEDRDSSSYKVCCTGQWTINSSMGLCVADSLLENNKEFNGVDLRTRFLYWWHTGYNNGLNAVSIGLGGGIADSFEYFYDDPKNPIMIKTRGLNNGNGSLTRLAAIPIAFLNNVDKGMKYAREQSFTTHDGEEAAECCRLLTFLIVNLINREKFGDYKIIFDELGAKFVTPCFSVEKLAKSEKESIEGHPKDFNKDENDRNWNWKKRELFQFSKSRLESENGIIGSYSMDGVAMALNITYNTQGVIKDVVRAVNLGGDCNSLGTIVGAISGAIHGLEKGLVDQYKTYISTWDSYTIAARALKLCQEK